MYAEDARVATQEDTKNPFVKRNIPPASVHISVCAGVHIIHQTCSVQEQTQERGLETIHSSISSPLPLAEDYMNRKYDTCALLLLFTIL
mmetsp:Transcript_28934/g.44207  ORF Transcript_28934/g.44207 Transcript_28934/m.44207 type:complete len:89 (-) Transcript_28934:100-366(-)